MNVRNLNILRHKKIIMLILLVLGVLTFFFFQKDYQLSPSYLGGDEPHYIMMTDSLSKDGEFNLRNDYEKHRSLDYYPVADLYPHVSPVFNKKSPEWYSIHTIGLPLILYGPYKLFGLDGVRMWMMLLQFSAVVLFFLLLKRYVRSPKRIWLGSGLLLICPLFWQNLGSIYPDLLMVSIWGTLLLLFGSSNRVANITIILLLLVATLTHSKGLVLIGPLVIFHVLWLIKTLGIQQWLRKYWHAHALIVLGGLSYVYFLRVKYGVWTPNGVYGNNGQLFSANPVINSIAMLTDRSKGLFLHFPLLLVVLPYVFRALTDLFRLIKKLYEKKIKSTQTHYLVGGVFIGLGLLLATLLGFNDWSGSTAPNGRSMLPVIFVVLFVVAKYINLRNWVEISVLSILSLLCMWLSWLSISDFVYYMSTGVNSFWVDHFPLLEKLPLFSLIAEKSASGQAMRGAKILAVVLVINLILIVLYRYKVTVAFKKWKAN